MAFSISSIATKIKLTFQQASRRIFSLLCPCSDQSTMNDENRHRTTATQIARSVRSRRGYRASLRRSQSADSLPIYMNEYLKEMQSNQMNSGPSGLGKTIVSLTFQAIVGLAVAFQSSSSSPFTPSGGQSQEDVTAGVPMHVVVVAMVFAFTVSFSGVFLRQSYPRTSWFFQMIGSVFLAIGFFVMTSNFIPKSLRWICWLACAFSLLVISFAFI